jgi:uncharacterized membrane protein YkoI
MSGLSVSKIFRAGAVAVTASLLVAAPAFAHGGGKGKSHNESEQHGKSGEHHGKSGEHHGKSNKPVLDLTTVTVTPAAAAAKAVTAAGGGDVLKIKLEAGKKGAKLEVDVKTPTGVVEVKLSPAGDVLKVEGDDDGDHMTGTPIAIPAAGVTFSTYAAGLPAGSSVIKIDICHNSKTNTDQVKVEYLDANGKKGKALLNLDGTPVV